MNLGSVSRLIATTAALTLFALPATASAAPSKGKGKSKDKAEEEAPAEEAEAEPEPEPEPEPAADEGDDGPTMKGRVGLGGTRSLSGVNGLSLRYYATPKLSIGALVGVATFSHRDVGDTGEFDTTRTFGQLGAGLQVFYWPVTMSREKYISADFGVGARGVVYVGFTGNDDPNPDVLEGPLEIDIEVPITTSVFIGDSVAITPEFGLVARIIPGSREPDDLGNADTNPGTGAGGRLGANDGPGLGFEIGDHAGVFFGLSITYFFGADKDKKKKKKQK